MPPDRAPVVARKPGHEMLERQLASFRQRRTDLRGQIEAVHISTPGMSGRQRELENAYRALDLEIRECRHALVPHRIRYLQSVRKAFREPSRAAAVRALAALAEFEAATAEINSMRAEVRRCGGECPDIAAAKVTMPLALALQRLAGDQRQRSEP